MCRGQATPSLHLTSAYESAEEAHDETPRDETGPLSELDEGAADEVPNTDETLSGTGGSVERGEEAPPDDMADSGEDEKAEEAGPSAGPSAGQGGGHEDDTEESEAEP